MNGSERLQSQSTQDNEQTAEKSPVEGASRIKKPYSEFNEVPVIDWNSFWHEYHRPNELRLRKVLDPITQVKTYVCDYPVNEPPKTLIPSSNIVDKDQTCKYSKIDPKSLVTPATRNTNIVFHPFPLPSLDAHKQKIHKYVAQSLLILCTAHFFVGAMGRMPRLACIIDILLTFAIFFRLEKILHTKLQDTFIDTENQRANTANLQSIPEGTEWLNTTVQRLWPILDSEILRQFADSVEDVMQASLPRCVKYVHIGSISQGKHPFRINALRILTDNASTVNSSSNDESSADTVSKLGYVNYEVSFSYQVSESLDGENSIADKIRAEIFFILGMKNVFGISLPVFLQICSIVGTLRIRAQMISQPPFVRLVTASLMGLPRVEIDAALFFSKFLNIMDLPLISTFIKSSIDTALKEYVAPKSITFDVSQLIKGDDVKRDTNADGILLIVIHAASRLRPTDLSKSSDPYVIVCFQRLKRPLFSTRIIPNTLNPVFEEYTSIAITKEIMMAQERLSFQIWDSDRVLHDELIGTVDFNLRKLIQKKNTMVTYHEKISHMDRSDLDSELTLSIGYYEKQQEASVEVNTSKIEERKQSNAFLQEPPNREYKSGILSIQVHQIQDLELAKHKMKLHTRGQFTEGQKIDVNQKQDSRDAPSSYCNVILNDEIIYRSRTKAFSYQPVFNVSCERFVREWYASAIMVAIRQPKDLEHHPILGLVVIHLSKAFKHSKLHTAWYPLQGGIGYGKVRISLLFTPFELHLPRSMLGWDIGTIEFVTSVQVEAVNHAIAAKLSSMKIVCTSNFAQKSIESAKAKLFAGTNKVQWAISKPIQLPLRKRLSAKILFDFNKPMALGGRNYFVAALALKHLEDEQWIEAQLGVYKTSDRNQFRFNYHHPVLTPEEEELFNARRVGTMTIKFYYRKGLSFLHLKHSPNDFDIRQVLEGFQTCVKHGIRTYQGEFVDESERKPQSDPTRYLHLQDIPYWELSCDEIMDSNSEAQSSSLPESTTSSDLTSIRDIQLDIFRGHRGYQQFKLFRTARWLKDITKRQLYKCKPQSARFKKQTVSSELS